MFIQFISKICSRKRLQNSNFFNLHLFVALFCPSQNVNEQLWKLIDEAIIEHDA